MRLFVSVDLPNGLAPAIAELQDRFADADGLRFTDPEQAHVTLKFLGEVNEERVPKIEEAVARALAEAEVSPFTATFGGLGVFPSLSYISVVWFGVEEGSEEFTRLFEAIQDRIVELGFEPESHEFTPHVTLARMEHAGGKEHVQEVVAGSDPTVGSMTVEDVRLTESTLTDSGPNYETVRQFPFRRGSE